MLRPLSFFFFFFNDTATTEIYTLSLHDALPICFPEVGGLVNVRTQIIVLMPVNCNVGRPRIMWRCLDRKSTRLNSSHLGISYAVFCLKKKKKSNTELTLFESETIYNRNFIVMCS